MKQSPLAHDFPPYIEALDPTRYDDIEPERWCLLGALLDWLAPAAHRLGLTKYAGPTELCVSLVAPTLRLIEPDLRVWTGSPMLDFGSGAGAVGLALATLLPDHQLVLADRRRRVIEFVDVAARRHGLMNCQSLLVDLSRPPDALCGHFGTVLIRSYGPVAEALALSRPWLRPHGCAALWHQPTSIRVPDGLTALRTVATVLPSLALTICQRA